MDGNGVSARFWAEVLDLRAPAADDPRGRRASRQRRRALLRRAERPRLPRRPA